MTQSSLPLMDVCDELIDLVPVYDAHHASLWYRRGVRDLTHVHKVRVTRANTNQIRVARADGCKIMFEIREFSDVHLRGRDTRALQTNRKPFQTNISTVESILVFSGARSKSTVFFSNFKIRLNAAPFLRTMHITLWPVYTKRQHQCRVIALMRLATWPWWSKPCSHVPTPKFENFGPKIDKSWQPIEMFTNY